MLRFTLVLILVTLPVPALASPESALTGKFRTEHFDIRYRPGSRAGAAVPRDAVMAERDFADICRKLAFTPKELLGKKSDWKPLLKAKLRPVGEGATWKRVGSAVTGSGTGGWSACELGAKKYGDCVVRARIRTNGIWGGVQLRLGEDCVAMLVGNGTCVWKGGGVVAMSHAEKVRVTGEVDLMLVRRGATMQVWVDGVKQVEGPVDASPRPIGIGFHTGPKEGSASFLEVRVRAL